MSRDRRGWRLFQRQGSLCEARRCREDEVVNSPHGHLTAHAGEWIVAEDGDGPRPVTDEVFRRTYQAIDDDG